MTEITRMKTAGASGRLIAQQDADRIRISNTISTRLRTLGTSWSEENSPEWDRIAKSAGLALPSEIGFTAFNDNKNAYVNAARAFYASETLKNIRTPSMRLWIEETYLRGGPGTDPMRLGLPPAPVSQ